MEERAAFPIDVCAARNERAGNRCVILYVWAIYSAISRRRLHGRGWPVLNLPINFERGGWSIFYTRHARGDARKFTVRMAFVYESQGYRMQAHDFRWEAKLNRDTHKRYSWQDVEGKAFCKTVSSYHRAQQLVHITIWNDNDTIIYYYCILLFNFRIILLLVFDRSITLEEF